jgi:foldase protein PrsA
MSEGTHSNPNPPNWSSRLRALGGNKPALFIAALGVAVLSAGLLMQVFRADDVAAEREGSRSSDGAGKARVSGSQQMAQVGDQVITYDAVAKECVKRYGEEVLEKLINRTIIQQACLKRGVSVTTVEVKQEVQTIAQKFKLDPTTWYQMLQAERNLSPLQYQRDIIWPMLALRKLAGDNIVITDEDRTKAFERDYGPRVEAKMIMLDNLRRAEEVWHRATQKKEDFSRLAREFSIEPTSRALGGDIPPIRMHIGSQEVIKQAFKLQVGETSGIIQAGPGRYVILLCEGFTERVASYKEVSELIEKHLMDEKRQEAVSKVFEEIKKEIRVDNYVTNLSSGGVRQASGTSTGNFKAGGKVVPTNDTSRQPASRTSGGRSPAPR